MSATQYESHTFESHSTDGGGSGHHWTHSVITPGNEGCYVP